MAASVLTLQLELAKGFMINPDHIALEYGNLAVSYRQLEEKAGIIAREIVVKGVEPGAFIGIYIQDRVDFIAALIGILNAGCVFVPLDTALPARRIGTMVQHIDMRVIVTVNSLYDSFIQHIPTMENGFERVILVDELECEGSAWSPLPQCRLPQPGDKLYLYFTSGTTGEPKAILGKNKSLLHFIRWEISAFSLDQEVRISQLTTPGFDAFLRDVFVPLAVGGTVCIPRSPDILAAAGRFCQWIEERRIHLIHCVPSLFRTVSMSPLNATGFPHLNYVLLSGEPINPHELKGWYETFENRIQLVNLYGPTETTLVKTYYLIQRADIQRGKIPIGKPMKGAQVLLFDKDMNICPPGTTGEIVIRTPYRTFGYYNNSRLNQRQFIPNPVSNNPDDLLYKTGDLGRELPDGNFECLGRMDRQVKIHGIRVEPGEIEEAVMACPGVENAVALPLQLPGQALQLYAFVVSPQPLEIPVLRQNLLAVLPQPMIPVSILQLPEIPLLPNGKIHQEKLKTELLQHRLTEEYQAPRTPEEKQLLPIIQELISPEGENLGINHDLFALGLQSLDVIRLSARIKEVFDVEITVPGLYSYSTIEGIGRQIVLHRQQQLVQELQEAPYVVFNEAAPRNLFFFPPQVGYGVIYKEFSGYLTGYTGYCFHFIEDGNPARQYADLIMGIQVKGPYLLLGYSAGGNLAFETAREIEQKGGEISDVVMIDSYRRQVKMSPENGQSTEEYFEDLAQSIDRMGIGFIKEDVIAKTREFTHYLENSVNPGMVNANIHHIIGTDREQKEAQFIITGEDKQGMVIDTIDTGWSQATAKTYLTYPGAGKHGDMLDPGCLEQNVLIVKRILNLCH